MLYALGNISINEYKVNINLSKGVKPRYFLSGLSGFFENFPAPGPATKENNVNFRGLHREKIPCLYA